jgi:hypothetical protein
MKFKSVKNWLKNPTEKVYNDNLIKESFSFSSVLGNEQEQNDNRLSSVPSWESSIRAES